ncbi:hypothetical protein BpHYR1_025854 [Brachionus plicatilis]|uniref:Uncharacterized protein n=1 Tax=Brachionus plicatilis TaxID=10195 RepID=A0A3M7RDB9_BRAPC|nr:hypothetical protein BpHYR1_025854 [Brachionus plicatilis]
MNYRLIILAVFSLISQSICAETESHNDGKLVHSRSILDVYYRTFYPDYKFMKDDYIPKYYDYNPYHGYNYKPYSYGFTYEYIPYKYDYPSKTYDQKPDYNYK